MNWKNKKVLVTGAGGFIGSHLVERLVELKANVSCFIRYNSRNHWGFIDSFPDSIKERLTIILGDLSDSDAVKKAVSNQDIIFHLGALIAIPYSYTNPRDFVQTNIIGTLNILTSARESNPEKIVHTSTSEVYGTAQKIPIDENHQLQAQSPYSATKIGADKLVESFYRAYDLPITILRPFNTYGPRQSARAIIPTIITQALTKNEIVIGDEKPTRDLTYVSDTVNGFIKIAEAEKSIGEVINIGTGTEISIRDLANKINTFIGKNCKIVSDPKRMRPVKSEVIRLCADINKARKLIDWQPGVSLDEGLKRTIDWISKNINLYKLNLYNI